MITANSDSPFAQRLAARDAQRFTRDVQRRLAEQPRVAVQPPPAARGRAVQAQPPRPPTRREPDAPPPVDPFDPFSE